MSLISPPWVGLKEHPQSLRVGAWPVRYLVTILLPGEVYNHDHDAKIETKGKKSLLTLTIFLLSNIYR